MPAARAHAVFRLRDADIPAGRYEAIPVGDQQHEHITMVTSGFIRNHNVEAGESSGKSTRSSSRSWMRSTPDGGHALKIQIDHLDAGYRMQA
jgi:hypothetical protein